jgi:hypothetical protein
MNASAPRPGYVYVLANPALEGWHKVGHTYRPPHRRARELSKTALPQAFATAFARFFWDAPTAERAAHRLLGQHLSRHQRRREFFQMPALDIRHIVEALPDAPLPIEPMLRDDLDLDAPWHTRVDVLSPPWAATRDGLEERWSWGEADLGTADPLIRRRGWQILERLSAEGWAEGSWRLADRIYQAQPGPESAERASWVFEAAERQGLPGGYLRAAWLRSWRNREAYAVWLDALAHAWRQWGEGRSPEQWPVQVRETLALERAVWVQRPDRQTASPWWQAWPLNEGKGELAKPF